MCFYVLARRLQGARFVPKSFRRGEKKVFIGNLYLERGRKGVYPPVFAAFLRTTRPLQAPCQDS